MKANKSTTYHPASSEDVAFTATPQDVTVPDDIYIMRVVADADAKITWVNAGTVKIVSGIPEYFQVHAGDPITIERDTADGNLQIAWMTN